MAYRKNSGKYPDFLCIGAQKAGTNWLYSNLKKHPEVWLPPEKEIHYFDYYNEKTLERWKRISSRLFLYKAAKHLANDLRRLSIYDFFYHIRYYFDPRKRNDGWYKRLFQPADGKVTGDITPSYSRLDKSVIQHIHEIMPNAKIIFILRNPIERTWSAARMNIRRRLRDFGKFNGNFENIPTSEYIRYFEKEQTRLSSNYPRTIANWCSYFPQERFFIGFLEDIKGSPQKFMLDIYRFLEISCDARYLPKTIERKFAVGIPYPMPNEVARYLAQSYLQEIEELSNMEIMQSAVHVHNWLETTRSLLEGSPRIPAKNEYHFIPRET